MSRRQPQNVRAVGPESVSVHNVRLLHHYAERRTMLGCSAHGLRQRATHNEADLERTIPMRPLVRVSTVGAGIELKGSRGHA
jgi:hypothetical protein